MYMQRNVDSMESKECMHFCQNKSKWGGRSGSHEEQGSLLGQTNEWCGEFVFLVSGLEGFFQSLVLGVGCVFMVVFFHLLECLGLPSVCVWVPSRLSSSLCLGY